MMIKPLGFGRKNIPHLYRYVQVDVRLQSTETLTERDKCMAKLFV